MIINSETVHTTWPVCVQQMNVREDARNYRANVRLLLMVNAGHAVPGDVYWFRSGDRLPMAGGVK